MTSTDERILIYISPLEVEEKFLFEQTNEHTTF